MQAESNRPESDVPVIFLDSPSALTLQNGKIFLALDPALGRIVGFGSAASRQNLIWLNRADQLPDRSAPQAWRNYGGDKVWVSQQKTWPFIRNADRPDPDIDGSPWQLLEATEHRAVLESRQSRTLNVRVRRTVTLAERAPRVTIHNVLHRSAPSPFPVHIWSITQIRPTECCLLHSAAQKPDPRPYLELCAPGTLPRDRVTELDASVLFRPPRGEPADSKIGTLGKWVAAVFPDWVLLQRHIFDPTACYPDGSSVQVYACPDYLELETLSPSLHLQPGEELAHTVSWELRERRPDTPPRQLAAELNAGND